MTWTYSGDPATSDRDSVRFLVGDTDTTDQLVKDEEIDWVLSLQAVLNFAASAVAETIAAGFARLADTKNRSLSVAASQRMAHYKKLAENLRAGGAGSLPWGDGSTAIVAEMFVGGLSIADKDAFFDDADAVQPSFHRGQDDNPDVLSENINVKRRNC